MHGRAIAWESANWLELPPRSCLHTNKATSLLCSVLLSLSCALVLPSALSLGSSPSHTSGARAAMWRRRFECLACFHVHIRMVSMCVCVHTSNMTNPNNLTTLSPPLPLPLASLWPRRCRCWRCLRFAFVFYIESIHKKRGNPPSSSLLLWLFAFVYIYVRVGMCVCLYLSLCVCACMYGCVCCVHESS